MPRRVGSHAMINATERCVRSEVLIGVETKKSGRRAAVFRRPAKTALFLLCLFLPSVFSAFELTQQASPEFRTVAPGVEHLRLIRGHKSEDDVTGPWLINVLRVDLRQADLRVSHALDEGVGLETTSSIAARHGATAAVNAGFFRTSGTYRGESSGVLMVDGKLISDPLDGRAAFGLIRNAGGGEIIFGHLKFSGHVKTSRGQRFSLSGLNRPRSTNELILYTPEFHRTTLTTPDGVEAVVRRNTIIRIQDGVGSNLVPHDGFVISASGTARSWLIENCRVGSQLLVSSVVETVASNGSPKWNTASFIVGGGPQLVSDGKVAITFEQEKIAPNFVRDRHPRTVIGRLNDGRVLIATVDGRQPGVSVGMSLPELAELALQFGAIEAINLDGGGSTTMVVQGKLVNVPSDQTGERPVSDAILIFARGLQRRSQLR